MLPPDLIDQGNDLLPTSIFALSSEEVSSAEDPAESPARTVIESVPWAPEGVVIVRTALPGALPSMTQEPDTCSTERTDGSLETTEYPIRRLRIIRALRSPTWSEVPL